MYTYGEYPMLRLVLPLCAGIVAFEGLDGLPEDKGLLIPLLAIGACCFAILFRTRYRFRWVSGMGINAGIFLAGWSSMAMVDQLNMVKPLNTLEDVEDVWVYAEVTSEPEMRGQNKLRAELKAYMADSNELAGSGARCLAYFRLDSNSVLPEAGDLIYGRAQVRTPDVAKNPGGFNYRNYLKHDRILRIASFDHGEYTVLARGTEGFLKRVSLTFSQWATGVFREQGLGSEELSVSLALILGRKQGLDRELFDRYAGAGVVHILCVSGLHVGILYLMLEMLLYPLGRNKWGKRFKLVLILMVIWFYALVTGLSPSVTRAATMFSLVAGGKILHRHHNIFNTIAGSAVLLLLIDPHSLYKIGFQLSYLAVLGIVSIQPIIFEYFKTSNRILNKILALLTVSFCAQLATAPLSIYYFGRFPVWFLLSNIVAVPLAGILLHLAMAFLVFSWIGPVRDIIGILLNKGLEALNFSVLLIDGMPFSGIEEISLAGTEVVLLYLAILSFVFLIRKGRRVPLYFMFSFLILFLFYGIADEHKRVEQEKIIIYNIPGQRAMDFIEGRYHVLISDTSLRKDEQQISYNLEGSWRKYRLKDPVWVDDSIQQFSSASLFYKEGFIDFKGVRLFIADSNFRYAPSGRRIRVDHLILSDDPKVTIRELIELFDFDLLVIDASNKPWNTERWKEEASELEVECYSVKDEGAFIRELRVESLEFR